MDEVSVTQAEADQAIREFANAILHGDEIHRHWLLDSAENFIEGLPLAPATQKSTRAEMEREIDELRSEKVLTEKRLRDTNQRVERLLAYTKKLERGIVSPEWFYFGDETTSDMCKGCVEEAMEDGLDDLTRAEAEAHQPFEVSTATSLPSIWVTIQTFDVEDPAPYQRGWDFEITEHASLEKAQAALAKAQPGEG